MAVTILSLSSPAYANAGNTAINCTITTAELGVIPFTASASDTEPHGAALWAQLLAGDYGTITPYSAPAADRSVLLAALAAHRYSVCSAGMAINGVPVQTDPESRANLMAAFILASANSAYSVKWKDAAGAFHTLNATALIAIGNTVAAFVQKCFSTEASLMAAIANYSDIPTLLAAFDTEMAA